MLESARDGLSEGLVTNEQERVKGRMLHHFTVDVEEYFHPTPLARWLPQEGWDELERRSPVLVERLLRLLDDHGTPATFFVLGWLAEREPTMVREISDAGHEIASHGWAHRLVTQLTPEEFREGVRRSKHVLEDLTGQPVVGYRAPSFSIVPGCEWALDVLVEEGYRYDSSLFPVRVHPTYGYPCERDPHLLDRRAGPIVEVPPSTLRVWGTNLPAAGGAYLRFLPYRLIRTAFRHAADRGAPGTFYVHPWEIDVAAPEIPIPRPLRLRVRGRLGDVDRRLQQLLRDFEFRRMRDTARELHPGLESERATPTAGEPEEGVKL